MARSKFWIKSGNQDPDLVVKLQRGNGTYPDLTGAVVRFRMKPRSGGTRKVNAVVATNNTEHLASHAWSLADTDTPGIYNGEFVVTYANGQEETFPTKDYIIIEVTSGL